MTMTTTVWEEKGVEDDDKWLSRGPFGSAELEEAYNRGDSRLEWIDGMGYIDFEKMVWILQDRIFPNEIRDINQVEKPVQFASYCQAVQIASLAMEVTTQEVDDKVFAKPSEWTAEEYVKVLSNEWKGNQEELVSMLKRVGTINKVTRSHVTFYLHLDNLVIEIDCDPRYSGLLVVVGKTTPHVAKHDLVNLVFTHPDKVVNCVLKPMAGRGCGTEPWLECHVRTIDMHLFQSADDSDDDEYDVEQKFNHFKTTVFDHQKLVAPLIITLPVNDTTCTLPKNKWECCDE